MTRTTFGILAVLAVAIFATLRVGGVVGMGILAGALCGTSVAALGASWQRHVFRTRPKQAMAAVVQTFLFKLAFVLIGALSFRYVAAASARVDWRAFLVAFVVSVLVVQILAVADNVRLLVGSKAPVPADPSLTESPSK